MTIEQHLAELKITLPPMRPPMGTYVHAKRVGNVLYLAGKGPSGADGTMPAGKLGREFTVEDGYRHARAVGLMLIAVMKETLGDLDRVDEIVKVLAWSTRCPISPTTRR